MATSVLDASAVLAFLKQEPGADFVAAHLPQAVISAANVIEVVAKLIDHGASPDDAMAEMALLALPVVPLDEALALRAGVLRAVTVRQGLSLGDRACLALAERESLPALTADRAWAGLDLPLQVVLIR